MSVLGDPRTLAASLDAEKAWDKLLYMRERGFGGETTMVDNAEFFFAPPEAWTPKAERAATIKAMLGPQGTTEKEKDQHAVCRYPARRAWLEAYEPGFAKAIGKPPCPTFEYWQKQLHTESVSLVFSSYFADNPSSMFGHSFLRLKKRPRPGKTTSDMLDETLNFMAYPTTDNPILYALMGLGGRFPGRFSMAPFYMKIQEYNNADSRDLWDYRLNLVGDEITALQRVMWEAQRVAINYFYFDENCSLILLYVLEAAKPSLELSAPHPWVIPSDTLRTLDNAPGLVTEVGFRPSARTKFLARYRALSDDERSLVDALIRDNDAERAQITLDLTPPLEQVHVIDAAVEFIDFDERLAGSAEAVKHKGLRQTLLGRRAKLRHPRMPADPVLPATEAPHLVAGTTRVGVGPGYVASGNERQGMLQAEWRPALHDLASPDFGYAPGLEITFFDTVVRYLPKTATGYVEHYDLLTILSIPHVEAITKPFAWGFAVGMENLGLCDRVTLGCYEEHMRGGIGLVSRWGAATAYGFSKAEVGFSGDEATRLFAGGIINAGVLWPVAPDLKLKLDSSSTRRFGPDGYAETILRGEFAAAWMPKRWSELRLAADRRERIFSAVASYYHYY